MLILCREDQAVFLGEKGDPALALRRWSPYALDDFLMSAENAALPDHGVPQRVFAVVARAMYDIADLFGHVMVNRFRQHSC